MRRHGNVNLSTHQAYSPQFNSEKHANCDNFPASIAGDQLLAILSYDPKYFTQICRHLYTIISAISTTWPCRTSISASDSYLIFTALSRPQKVHQKLHKFATNWRKLALIDQNRPKFRVLSAKQYTDLKKYTTAGCGGGDYYEL